MTVGDGGLWEAFRATVFRAEAGGRQIAIRVGEPECESLRETMDDCGATRWAYITAWNPNGEDRPPEENRIANAKLRQELESRGLPFFEGAGEPEPPSDHEPEASYLVLGIERSTAIELGRRFGQVAIVFGTRGNPAELCACFPDGQERPKP